VPPGARETTVRPGAHLARLLAAGLDRYRREMRLSQAIDALIKLKATAALLRHVVRHTAFCLWRKGITACGIREIHMC
jgi:hypothetical protein